MAEYVLYICRPDGVPILFEAFALDSDRNAWACARNLLSDHASASHVEMWCGDRWVGIVRPARELDRVRPNTSATGLHSSSAHEPLTQGSDRLLH